LKITLHESLKSFENYMTTIIVKQCWNINSSRIISIFRKNVWQLIL